MTDFIKSFVLLPFVALFVFGCLRVCDIEYANDQQKISQWQAQEQVYISPADQMVIDWHSPTEKGTLYE